MGLQPSALVHARWLLHSFCHQSRRRRGARAFPQRRKPYSLLLRAAHTQSDEAGWILARRCRAARRLAVLAPHHSITALEEARLLSRSNGLAFSREVEDWPGVRSCRGRKAARSRAARRLVAVGLEARCSAGQCRAGHILRDDLP